MEAPKTVATIGRDKERNEGENLASLGRREVGPQKQQADKDDIQKNDGGDCVVCHCLFLSEMAASMIHSLYRMPPNYPVKSHLWAIWPVENGSMLLVFAPTFFCRQMKIVSRPASK